MTLDYYIVVRSEDELGNEDTNTIERKFEPSYDNDPPVFNGIKSITGLSPTHIKLCWDSASDDQTDESNMIYDIYLASSSGNQNYDTPSYTSAAGDTCYIIDGLTESTDYYAVVRARDETGNNDENTIEDTGTTLTSFNLIQNPGCEETLVDDNIPQCVEVAGTTWTQRNSSPPPHGGSYYFFPGASVTNAELAQTIDVSLYTEAIEHGTQQFSFQGWVSSWTGGVDDTSRVIIELLDSSSTLLSTAYDSTETAFNGWNVLTQSFIVEPDTHYIYIRLLSRKLQGTNNDGYYDDLSLLAK
jgi:hypothetical protein